VHTTDNNQFLQELTDEIAISTKGRENLIFAVGGLPFENRTMLSHAKNEFILKCSFNHKDCDIEKYRSIGGSAVLTCNLQRL
jgi:hypothetical protein